MDSTIFILLLLAVVALAIGVPKALEWGRRPHLRLSASKSAGQGVRVEGRHARWWAIRIENPGGTVARGCRGTLETLEYWDGESWRAHPGFPYSIQLRWVGEGLSPLMDLRPADPPRELALCLTFEGSAKLQLASAVDVLSGILLDYPAGLYRMRVSVTGAEDGIRGVRPFAVEFDGNWEGVVIRAAD